MLEKTETKWKKLRSPPVSEEAEVADAHEAAREQVEEEAAQELIDGQGHEPLLVGVSGISPAEGDVAVGEGNESVVGDGDAMGVGTEIAQRVFRPAEGALGVDDPVVAEQESEPGGKGPLCCEWCEVAVELECACMEGVLESGDELAAEHAAEHFDGEKEGAAGGDPAGVVRSEAAGGEHAVDMGMMLQALVPGMEHAEEADLGAEVPGIASDLEQGRGAGVEQQVINQPLVLQGKRGQFAREGEDDMHVAGGEQLALAGFEPAHTGVALASWAMPITARIVGDGGMSAAGALIAMSAQRSGAATGDGQQHLLMLPVNPPATALYEVVTSTVNDVGHLQRRSVHALRDTPAT